MSDNLVRRQKFARELRRKQVEEYMRKIRERLLVEGESPHLAMTLTQDQLKQMKREMENQQYTTASVERFLLQLKKYSVESLCTAEFFVVFEVAILYVLQFGNNTGPNALVHSLAKQIVARAIECGANLEGRLPLEFCIKEVLQILTNQDTEMSELWKSMALVRSEWVLEASFKNFLFYVSHYQQDLISILPTIFEVFANFTATIEGCEKVSLTVSNIFDILTKLEVLLGHYTVEYPDIAIVTRVLENILKMHTFSAMTELLSKSKIISCLVDLLKETNTQRETKGCVLQFMFKAFSGPDFATRKLISSNEQAAGVIGNFLPSFGSVLSSAFLPERSPQLQSAFSRNEVQNALIFFGNLAACSDCGIIMIKYGILDWYIAASAFNSSVVHSEIAIYLFNMMATSTDQQAQVYMERGVLMALNNVIREEYCFQATYYGLRALLAALKHSVNFPSSNIVWHFSLPMVRNHCQRMELVKYLEGMLVSKKEQLASYAELCLNILIDKECI